MKNQAFYEYLWGSRARLITLICCSIFLIFAFLGARDIWTQEHRWADIVAGMFYRKDFLHPYLGEVRYYDKPLLSYWLIAFCVKVIGFLNATVLRIPTAVSGFIAVIAMYSLGSTLKDKQFGLLAGWLLLSTFYFLYWSRVASADMLNLAGTLCAIAWYMAKRDTISIYNYSVFFLILASTALCKGLVVLVTVFLAVGIDLLLNKNSRGHLNSKLILACLPACLLYFFPFWLSAHFDPNQYGDSGLYLVYKENILRYLKPFDHQGHWYTYLIYLPVYTIPWAIFLIPAFYNLRGRWATMSLNSRWISLTLVTLFAFFTLSGSRRSYYVLPMVPFAILMVADWMDQSNQRLQIASRILIGSLIFSFVMIDLVPTYYYSHFGATVFANKLKDSVTDWSPEKVVLLDTETKIKFYLNLPPQAPSFPVLGDIREKISKNDLRRVFPILSNLPSDTIFVSRKLYEDQLKNYFKDYAVIELSNHPNFWFFKGYLEDGPIAFVPLKMKKT